MKSKLERKTWMSPQLILIGTDGVKGGTHVGTNEANFSNSHTAGFIPGFTGKFFLYKVGGGTKVGDHSLNYYQS